MEFEGNSKIPTDTLEAVFDDVGLSSGEIYNPSLLDGIQLELERQYSQQGRYNAQVNADITPLTRNRVAVVLNISEGDVARVSHFKVVGNQVFSDGVINQVLELKETDKTQLSQLVFQNNQFSSAALQGDIQRLEDFYLDQGYLDFSIESQQISVSESKSDVTILLNIVEGQPYRVADVSIIGDTKEADETISSLVKVEVDQIYSRRLATGSAADIQAYYQDLGYAFAQVRDIVQPTEQKDRVNVVFQVNP